MKIFKVWFEDGTSKNFLAEDMTDATKKGDQWAADNRIDTKPNGARDVSNAIDIANIKEVAFR